MDVSSVHCIMGELPFKVFWRMELNFHETWKTKTVVLS